MQFVSNTKSRNHKHAICELLEWADKCILCTSFFDRRGFGHISDIISSGIENRGLDITIYSNGEDGYTTPSAIKAAAALNGVTHKVINGRRLHSKIYFFEKGDTFKAMIGSANITHNGLVKNIEFSVVTTGSIGSTEHQEIQNNLLQIGKLSETSI
jgi:HKD family nuclease